MGQQYRYVINNSMDRRDPRSRQVTSEPSPGCQNALESVRNIAHRVVAAQPSAEAVAQYTRAIECEIKAGHGEAFGKGVAAKAGPTEEERKAFGVMIEQLAQP